MTSAQFVNSLRELNFENTFNPYSDHCSIHDSNDAPILRANTLQAILEVAVESDIDALWIGRDLGYRGGRRTGLALTDDIHISAHIKRWGLHLVDRPTKGHAVAERTAAVIWRVLSEIEVPVFLWNVFPLHPHQSNDPFSNRSHNTQERKAGEELLLQLISLLRPRRLIAIGNDAAKTAKYLASDSHEIIQVRHPSYGGQKQFLEKIQNLYSLSNGYYQTNLF